MYNTTLLKIIDTQFKSHTQRGDEYLVHCPYCHHTKHKLSINVVNYKWKCWVCLKHSSNLKTLLYKIGTPDTIIAKLDLPTQNNYINTTSTNHVSLPLEYIPIVSGSYNSPDYRNAVRYLKLRGIDKYDVLRYNIGYCETGIYSGMIILPSYDEYGILNYFSARSFYETTISHKLPNNVSKDIIGYDLLINWNNPVNIVEAPFDAITCGSNSIPLFGKTISDKLKIKLSQKSVRRINLILDPDAIRQSIEHTEYLMNNGIDVHLIKLIDKDANEMGKDAITRLIEISKPIDFYNLIELKLEH